MMESNDDVDDIESLDVSTGLFPFMAAAVGNNCIYDLDSLLHLIKLRPLLVQQYIVDGREELFSRKQKRC